MALAIDLKTRGSDAGALALSLKSFDAFLQKVSPAALPLPWPELEEVLPDRGFPRGVVELSASRALGGATRVALASVRGAQAQNPKAWCAWLDPEGSLYAPGVAKLGVDLRRLLVVRPPRGELVRIATKLAQAGAFDVIVIDYATPALPAPTLREKGKLRSEVFVRKLSLLAEDHGSTIFLLTDLGDPRPLPWPVALRLELSRAPGSLTVKVAKDRLCRLGSAKIAWPGALTPSPNALRRSDAEVRAIVFERIALELAHQRLTSRDQGAPLAIVIARPLGAVRGETTLLGNTRLSEVSVEARALGVRAGQTIASARAKISDLRVRVVEQATVQASLVTVAELALSFGATTAFEAGGVAGDVVWVDVSGCAHLHARAGDPEGERSLAEALVKAVRALGHESRVAIADGSKVAAAVARFSRTEVSVVPPHGNARAMGRLPLSALGLKEDAVGWLSKIGVRKVSDLQRLPRAALATRLGADAPRVRSLLDGDDRAPLRPHVPPEKPVERLVLEYGITHHEALLFVVKRLVDRLAVRLEGRVKKAAKLLLRLEVDHGVAGAPAQNPTLPLTLASPLAKASELFAVVRAKIESPDGAARVAIERQDDGTMDVPILAVSLEVTEEVAAERTPQDLFVPEARADRALPGLVAELSAELGVHAVGILELTDTWVLRERSRLVPYRASPSRHEATLVSAGEELSRLLPTPKPVLRSALTGVQRVARSEFVEWWKPGGGVHDELVTFWEDRGPGQVGRGTAWISVHGQTGDAFLEGWLD